MKRKLSVDGAFWPGADLFIEAFKKMDPSHSSFALLDCFEQEAPFEALQAFLFDYFEQSASPHDVDPVRMPVEVALHMMQSRLSEEITQSGIAEELGLNSAYFSTLFRKVSGDTFVNTLNAMRIEQAIVLMESGERNMDKVAQSCGYTNKKYFFAVFRKKTRMTVTEYLEEMRQ